MGRHNEEKLIPYPLAAGLDIGRDPKMPGGPIVLENVEFKYRGLLSKREGTSTLDSTNNDVIAEYGGRPVTIGSDGIEMLDSSDPLDGEFESVVSAPDKFFDVNVIKLDATHTEQITNPSMAVHGDYFVVGYTAGTTLYVKVYHRYAKTIVDSVTLATSVHESANVKVIVNSAGSCYIFYTNSSGNLKWREVNSSGVISSEYTPSSPPPTADTTTNQSIDACLFGDGSRVFLCYWHGDYNYYVIGFYSTEPGVAAVINAAVIKSDIAGDTSAVCPMGANGIIMYEEYNSTSTNYETYAKGYDITLSVVVTTALLHDIGAKNNALAGVELNSTSIMCYNAVMSNIRANTYTDSSGTGVAGTAAYAFKSCWMHSKPFSISSDDYMWVYLNDGRNILGTGITIQRSLYLIRDYGGGNLYDIDDVRPYAKALIDRAHSIIDADSYNARYSPTEVVTSGNSIYFASPFYVKTDIVALAIIEFSDDNPVPINLKNTLGTLSSLPSEFDGTQLVEQGFLMYPWEPSAGLVAGSGINLGIGTYSYVATYEWIDAKGNRHISAPSVPDTIEIDSSSYSGVDVDVVCLRLTWKQNVKINIYRTTVDGPITLMYKLASIDNLDSPDYYDTVCYSDNISDDDLIEGEGLYTNGIILENIQPPLSRISTTYQRRQFMVDREREDYLIRYSKEFLEGEGIAHSDTLVINVSTDGGDMTALVELDDKLIIFKEGLIYATYGTALNDVGAGLGYATPMLVSNAAGCINRKSIAKIPQGIIFESKHGLCLLKRDMTIDLTFGDRVKLLYDTEVSINCAIVVPEKQCVIFFDNEEYYAHTLVYNYKFDLWSTFYCINAQSAVIAGDYLYFIDVAGHAKVFTGTLDDSTIVPMRIDTGWLSFAHYQRVRGVYIIGQNISQHTLSVNVAWNYDPVWQDEQQFSSSGLEYFDISSYLDWNGLSSSYENQAYILKCEFAKQKCTSVRVKITDAAASEGESFSISALIFIVKPLGGGHRLDSDRRL